MIELYCGTTGELLGGAAEWRWPVDGKDGLLRRVLLLDKWRYRFAVIEIDQERIELRWREPDGSWRAVAGRVVKASPAHYSEDKWTEVFGPVWLVEEIWIAVTGAAD